MKILNKLFRICVGKGSSFTYLNATQFLGAFNDNLFRFIIVLFLIGLNGIEHSDKIGSYAAAIFVIPFLLFSATSGTLADRYSKRNIIVLTKAMEVAVMGLGALALYFESEWGAYAILFLMATQSAIFSPSKYGIVPELVKQEKIAQANGLLTSLTYGAIILGTLMASVILNVTGGHFVIAGFVCFFVAVIGLLTSLGISYTNPSGARRKFNAMFIREIFHTYVRASRVPTLLIAMIGSAYFLYVGAFIQINIIPFAAQNLDLQETEALYLFFVTSVGIGLGALTVGKISGKWVELGVTPIGGILLSLFCMLLYCVADSLPLAVLMTALAGFWGGIYLLPLDAYIQVASPKTYRGQCVAAANFLAYIGVVAAAVVVPALSRGFGYTAAESMWWLGSVTLFLAIGLAIYLRDYVIRFLGMVFSRVCFELDLQGHEKISAASPAILLATYHSWIDSLLLFGSQRRRIHFFIECHKGVSIWVKLLRKFFKVSPNPSLLPEDMTKKTIREARKALKRGQTVCIFMEAEGSDPDLEALAEAFREMRLSRYPIIPVNIQTNPKNYPDGGWFLNALRWIRVPARVRFLTEH